MDTWLRFLGRLHPLLLHLPIGALALLIGAELWTRRPSARPLERGTRAFLCALTALTALAGAGTGWLLGEDFQSSGFTFEWHRNLGIAFAATTALAALSAVLDLRRVYAPLLGVAALLLLPVGHFGAQMTHGADFLFEPFRSAPPPATPTGPSQYELVIAPIFEASCLRCHGAEKQKGGLALHEFDLLRVAGDSGLAPIVPGDAAASEILRRLRLAPDDDEHMPPPSKPQPTAEEIEALEHWIATGASLEAPATDAALAASRDTQTEAHAEPAVDEPPASPPAEAIAALRAEHVHVELLDPQEELLWIDFGARPATDDTFAQEHLAPLAPFVIDLDLARTAVGDGLLDLVARMPRLERLDVARTECSPAGIAELSQHPTLSFLNLTGTRVNDSVLDHLEAMPALRRAFLGETAVTAEGLAALAQRATHLSLAGEPYEPSQPIEVEPPVQMGRFGDLSAVNSLCPVSGSAVDPAFRVVHAGRVVGFCCAECPGKFWAAPADFPLAGD